MSTMSLPEAVPPVAGWDIGGAHVKLALCREGRVEAVMQRACPLWQGMHHLDRALDDLLAACDDARRAEHAITMTGEMTDLFVDRAQGVARLAQHLRERLGPDLRFYAGPAQWCDPAQAPAQWRAIASANWCASATLVAAHLPNAIFVDIGSTTTDLVPIVRGAVAAQGVDDASRLARRELVYHGVVRTPLCVLASRIEFRGTAFNVMNEWFATMADVYRLTDELAPEHDQQPAADNGDKTEPATCTRLARMIGHDASAASVAEWRAFAATWRERQLQAIERDLDHVRGVAGLADDAPLVGAGCGDFLARALAARRRSPYVSFDRLVPVAAPQAHWARVCAPSVAVAWLYQQERATCGS